MLFIISDLSFLSELRKIALILSFTPYQTFLEILFLEILFKIRNQLKF